MDFVSIVLEEIADDINDKLRYNALSTRLSKLEPDDFMKFMKDNETEDKTEKVVIDHEAQMRQAMQG